MTHSILWKRIQVELNGLADSLPKTSTIEIPEAILAWNHVDGMGELCDTLRSHRVRLEVFTNLHVDACKVTTRSQKSNDTQSILDSVRVHVNGVDGHAVEAESSKNIG